MSLYCIRPKVWVINYNNSNYVVSGRVDTENIKMHVVPEATAVWGEIDGLLCERNIQEE